MDSLDERVIASLVDALGAEHVLTDPQLTSPFGTDWTGRFTGPVLAVVRPGTPLEVAIALSIARSAGVPVIPQGGNTGLVGGSVPGDVPAIVLSTRRLDGVGPFDEQTRTIEVGAGATIAEVQQAARDLGLDYGVDFAARDSATIGGSIATDAGGLRVCHYGATGAQIDEVHAVRADGNIYRGDPGQLVGSEGTLAVIVGARLRLVEPLGPRITALIPVDDIATAIALLPSEVLAAEYLERSVLELTGGPTDKAAALLLEVAADAVVLEPPDLPDDAIVAVDQNDVARLWEIRERATEKVSTLGVPLKLDVAVPLDRMVEFREALSQTVGDTRLFLWGHLFEGKLHINLLDADVEQHTDAVLRLVAAHGGSIASEHGVGRAKARWFEQLADSSVVAQMGARKRALDPDGILNPGAILTRY